jgi:hypothetical protein
MLVIDVMTAYVICAAGSLIGAAMLRLIIRAPRLATARASLGRKRIAIGVS